MNSKNKKKRVFLTYFGSKTQTVREWRIYFMRKGPENIGFQDFQCKKNIKNKTSVFNCFATDAKNKKNLNFINELDKLYIAYNVIPSVIKDSRIKKEVFDKCYKFANEFREDLRNFDHKRSYRSELSDRLGL